MESWVSTGLEGASDSLLEKLRARVFRWKSRRAGAFTSPTTMACWRRCCALRVARLLSRPAIRRAGISGQRPRAPAARFTRQQLPDEIWLRCVRENEKAWRWYEREGFAFEKRTGRLDERPRDEVLPMAEIGVTAIARLADGACTLLVCAFRCHQLAFFKPCSVASLPPPSSLMPHGGRMGPISCDVQHTGGGGTHQARHKESGAQGQGRRRSRPVAKPVSADWRHLRSWSRFSVQKFGLTIFENEGSDAPMNGWGWAICRFARVRAAAPAQILRFDGSAYPAGAFEPLLQSEIEVSASIKRGLAGNRPGHHRQRKLRALSGHNEIQRGWCRAPKWRSSGIGAYSQEHRIVRPALPSVRQCCRSHVYDGATYEEISRSLCRPWRLRLQRVSGVTEDPLTKLDEIGRFPNPPESASGSTALRKERAPSFRPNDLTSASHDSRLPSSAADGRNGTI